MSLGFLPAIFYKGNIIIIAGESPVSLFDARIATMEDRASVYGRSDAIMFIRLNAAGLPPKTLQKNNVRKLGNR